jgi:hypothetical protein
MKSRREFVSALGAAALVFPVVAVAKEWTTLRVIVQDDKGQPIPRAAVIIRQLKGKKLKNIGATYELKTSLEGSAPVPPLPRGHIMVQVISSGFQTHGSQVHLTELEQTVTIKLEQPQTQHSVHTK